MEVKLEGLEAINELLNKAQEQLSDVRKTIREIYDTMSELTVKISQPRKTDDFNMEGAPMNTYYVLQFKGDSGKWLTCDDEQYATLEEAAAALDEVSGGPVQYRIAEAYFVVRYRPVK